MSFFGKEKRIQNLLVTNVAIATDNENYFC